MHGTDRDFLKADFELKKPQKQVLPHSRNGRANRQYNRVIALIKDKNFSIFSKPNFIFARVFLFLTTLCFKKK